MKQETKELIAWLKDHLMHYRNQLAAGQIKIGLITGEKEEKNAYKAIHLLNSLPDIEKKLCFGGYVQDKNGTPCCHGDKVIVIDEKGKNYYGRLVWSDVNKVFRIQNAKERKEFYFPVEFEKVGLFKAGE